MYKGESCIKTGFSAGVKTKEFQQPLETKEATVIFFVPLMGVQLDHCQAVISGQVIHLGYFNLPLDVAAIGIQKVQSFP